MTYATRQNDGWLEKTPRQFREEQNASIPNANLEAEGLFEVTVDPEPTTPGKIIERGPIVERDKRPYQTWTERDPTVDEVEQERKRLHRRKDRAYSDAMRPVSEAYPVEEREGWSEQVRAAQDVKDGKANGLIDKLRGSTGETANDMADRIIALREQYLTVYGTNTAARRGLTAQIDAAPTLADLQSIDIEGAFTP